LKAFVLILFVLVFASCTKTPRYKKKTYSERNMNSVTAGVELPVSLWSKLEAVPGEKAVDEPWPTKFFGIRVFLSEKNRGILGGVNHELIYGEGGGELDLADFLQSKNGSFYFAIEAMIEGKPDKPKPERHVFYLSNAVKRRLGNEAVGAGCGTYHDITGFIDNVMKGEGIQVNTTAGRHVSTLAGTYFFAIPYENHLYLAHLTVKDSRFRVLHCRR
jgi:hypothetical protein